MVLPPLTTTLRHSMWTGVLFVCFLLNGCAPLIRSSVGTFADGQAFSGSRSSRSGFNDPFRGPTTANRSGSIAPVQPFAWTTAATTASGEPLQTSSTGQDGFRSLIIGSVGGDDPAAVKLTDELAHYLNSNQLIMGGVNATVLRTLNPDGMKLARHQNSDGVYLNDRFPGSDQPPSAAEVRRLPKEIQFLIGLVSDLRPQRIIHIRTVRGSRGMLAVSHGAIESGREVAAWLDFSVRHLPGDVKPGTLESWAARRGDCDVITVGIPRRTEPDDAWALYGDAVLSLLLDGNSESRQMAREQKMQRSAKRQLEWDNKTVDDMFRED